MSTSPILNTNTNHSPPSTQDDAHIDLSRRTAWPTTPAQSFKDPSESQSWRQTPSHLGTYTRLAYAAVNNTPVCVWVASDLDLHEPWPVPVDICLCERVAIKGDISAYFRRDPPKTVFWRLNDFRCANTNKALASGVVRRVLADFSVGRVWSVVVSGLTVAAVGERGRRHALVPIVRF